MPGRCKSGTRRNLKTRRCRKVRTSSTGGSKSRVSKKVKSHTRKSNKARSSRGGMPKKMKSRHTRKSNKARSSRGGSKKMKSHTRKSRKMRGGEGEVLTADEIASIVNFAKMHYTGFTNADQEFFNNYLPTMTYEDGYEMNYGDNKGASKMANQVYDKLEFSRFTPGSTFEF